MATRLNSKALERQWARALEVTAEINQKLEETQERKKWKEEQVKQKEKEAKPKDVKGKCPKDKMFYPAYQKVTLRVAMEFVMRMKEEKEPTLYKTYIGLVIKHVGVVDTSVHDTTIDDVWQMIRDKKCTYITGEDDEESEDWGTRYQENI